MGAEATCAACGQSNPAGAKFCNECGTPLAGEAGQEVRKTLTVLFADLVGFTSLGERLDQESLRRVMDRFYEEMRGAVHAHGGTVAKFIGDAVMAVWGTPVVREDDALRAVRAAEEMRAALAALNVDLEQRWGVRVGMRTGVNTGEVVVDPTKPADLLVGDTLNVAARLEQAAADGDVLVGPETYRLVRAEATLEPVEPLQLKGKTRRLTAYRLVDGRRPERRREDRLRAPLVGRDAEIDRLRAAFDAAVVTGQTRLVTVIGSPGVGKSRLARELTARLKDDARILRGHCEPVTEGATFLPVAEVLREAGGLSAVPQDEPRVREAFGALLGDGGPVAPEETFWAVRRFLEALSRERPVVVVLDDIHWGEPTFLDLLEHLAAWGRDGPVLLVALARPELRDTRPALTEGAVALEPLARDESRALVDGLLGAADLPDALAERLLETADGNPLFLGEMLRMLVDDGVLRHDGDTWTVAEAEQVSVPPTIHALLAARLERLPPAERTVAQRAAVIGPQFSRAAVAELAGEPLAAAIDEHLDALRRKELIATAPGPGGEPAYRFGHALIRDAAYRPLLKEARADLHERFARWLEAHGAEQDEIIGFHLERAYGYLRELGPLDDSAVDLGRRAGERLREAGRRALDREDLPAATNLLGRALDVLPHDDAARGEALLDLAEALLSAGDTARGGEVVEELALRAEAAADERLQALATVYGGQLANLVGAGRVRDTIALLDVAAATLRDAGDPRGEAKAHHVAAGAHALLGEVAAAEAALDRALVAARAAGDRRRVTAVLSGAPRAALWGPSPVVRASGRCLDVVRIVRMTPGHRHVETMALRCQAVLEAMRGRADAGRAILRDGRAALEELGLTLELHELDTYAGTVELLAGDPAAAEERLRAARDGFAALGVDTGAAQAAALLARAVLESGRDDEALALTEFAERRGGEDLKTAIAWRGVRAEALARRGEHDAALRLARDAVALAEPTDALADKADALMALAEVLRGCGDEAGARDAAARARDVYAAKEHEAGVARAAAAAGDAAREPARGTRPAAVLGESPPERVGAEWFRRINAEDWDGLRELYCDDARTIDRTGDGADIDGADAMIGALRASRDLIGDFEWRPAKVLATSETEIAWVVELSTSSMAGGGPALVTFGQVVTLVDGRIKTLELFRPEDEDAVIARFDELRAQVLDTPLDRLMAESLRCLNARDWEGMRRCYAPGFRLFDHRRQGADMDLDQTIEAFEQSHQLVRGLRWSRTRLVRRAEHVAATILELRGELLEGGPVSLSYGSVLADRDGLLQTSDLFEPDDEDGIVARFEELRAESDPVRLAPGVPPDHPHLAAIRAQCTETGDAAQVLAAFGRVTAHVFEASGEAVLAVHDDGGRLLHEERLAGEDRHAVLRRFDELVVERASTPGEKAYAALAAAYNARDWVRLRDQFAGEFSHVDGRDVGLWEITDADDVVAQLRTTTEVTPDVRLHLHTLAAEGDVIALRSTWVATFSGAPMENGVVSVGLVRDGRIARIEQFDRDDEAGLRARFEELRAESGPVHLSPGVDAAHPLVGRTRRQCEAFNRRDWAAVRDLFAPGYEASDRRAVGWQRLDRDLLIETGRSAVAAAPDMATTAELLACGDGVTARVQHYRGHAVDGGGLLDVSQGEVAVYDSEGRVAREEFFDPDDRDALLTRFDELQAAVAPPDLRPAFEFVRHYNARAWEAVRTTFADDLVLVDHRSVSLWEVRGADPLVEHLRAGAGTSSDVRISVRTIAHAGPLWRGDMTWLGTFRGAPTEIRVKTIVVLRDERIVRIEQFEPEDDAEWAHRYEELRADRANLAVLARRRFVEAFEARDWPALRALYADDAISVDHRPLGFGTERGGDTLSRLLRGIADVGGDRWASEVVAVAGRRLALFSEEPSGTTADGDPISGGHVWMLIQTDADGRIWHLDAWGADGEAEARERLAQLGEIDAANHARTRLFAAKDWEALAEFVAPDAVMEYRPLEQRFEGRDAVLRQWRAAFDASEVTCVADRLDAPAPNVRVARERWSGSMDGAEWEVEQQAVARVDGAGRMVRCEIFEVGDPRWDEAVARLAAAATPPA